MSSIRIDLQALIEGAVLDAPESLDDFARDFGRVVYRRPRVVVRPASTDDVARLLSYASRHEVAVTSRATGCSFGGQCLSEDGVVLDMKSLRRVHRIENEWFQADAGAPWSAVLDESLPRNLVPPVLTNHHAVTLGGSHSAGGIGRSSFRYGLHADNCLGLEVVTAAGEVLWCDVDNNAELFRHVLCSYGQLGLITQVRHRLRPYQPLSGCHRFFYADLGSLLDDCRSLILGESDITHIILSISMYKSSKARDEDKKQVRWGYLAEIVVEGASSDELDVKLADGFIQLTMREGRYLGHQDISSSVFFRSLDTAKVKTGLELIHPSIDVVLPWSVAVEYISTVLSGLPLALPKPYRLMTTISLLLLDRRTIHTPLFCLPDRRMPEGDAPNDEILVGFGLHPYIPVSLADSILPHLALVSELALEMGGKRYLVGWLPFEPEHWKRQLGSYQDRFVDLKRRYDPERTLNPSIWQFVE